jgi:uncharacterized membrane protein YphA (DoxX/SURF4 family)
MEISPHGGPPGCRAIAVRSFHGARFPGNRRRRAESRSTNSFVQMNEGGNRIKNILAWLLNPPTNGPASTLLLRFMAGGVFLWEGVLKFVYANQGVGRFTKLGMPFPHATAHFVGGLEIVGGLLLQAGLLTRLIAIPFLIEMVVAILATKIPMYLGHSPLALPPSPPQVGIWAVLHEVRSEYAQLLTTAFLLINGPGKWSLDARIADEAPHAEPGLGTSAAN